METSIATTITFQRAESCKGKMSGLMKCTCFFLEEVHFTLSSASYPFRSVLQVQGLYAEVLAWALFNQCLAWRKMGVAPTWSSSSSIFRNERNVSNVLDVIIIIA